MNVKRYAVLFLFVVVVGHVSASESYMDYGEETAADRTPAENIRELYRLLLQRNLMEKNDIAGGIPLEHLMIRKSQRSPSLRLRFGRSGPHISAMMRPASAETAAATAYDDNNNNNN